MFIGENIDKYLQRGNHGYFFVFIKSGDPLTVIGEWNVLIQLVRKIQDILPFFFEQDEVLFEISDELKGKRECFHETIFNVKKFC